MSLLLKSGSSASKAARPAGVRRQSGKPADSAADERLAWQLRVEELTAKLDASRSQCEQIQSQVTQAYRDGEAAGRLAGAREAADREAERIARLDRAVDQALKVFSQETQRLEELAGLLACDGLERVLGDAGQYRVLIAEAVRQQIQSLEGETAIAIEVSGADFQDQPQIDALSDRVGRPDLTVSIRPELLSGECRIRLTLGVIEAGISHQWPRLRRVLESLADQGRA